MLKDLTKKNAARRAADARRARRYADLAWAPTADVNLIAMRDDPDGRRLGPVPRPTSRATRPTSRCKAEPSFAVIRALHWAPGRALDPRRSASRRPERQFGIVRWRVKNDKPAFSPDVADWNKGSS